MGIGVGHGRGGGARGRSWRPMAEINVTPFVDVMLVLLIVFMVTAPLLTAGVAVDLPNASAPPIATQDASPLEITVDAAGQVFVGESAVAREKLGPMLAEIAKTTPDRQVYLRGDAGAGYGQVAAVLATVSGAGFTKLALVTENQGG